MAKFANHIYVKLSAKYHPNGDSFPEGRLPPAMLAAILVPASMYWFAWTGFTNVHWAVPVASGVPFGWCMVMLFVSTPNPGGSVRRGGKGGGSGKWLTMDLEDFICDLCFRFVPAPRCISGSRELAVEMHVRDELSAADAKTLPTIRAGVGRDYPWYTSPPPPPP